MNSKYVFLRFSRKKLPKFMVNFFIKRGTGITNPKQVVEEYEQKLGLFGDRISDKTILEFGYGGSLGTALELLRRGAKRVYLNDKYEGLNNKLNQKFYNEYKEYVVKKGKKIIPKNEYISIIEGDINNWTDKFNKKIDIIFSNAVLEHVDNERKILESLKRVMSDNGTQVHFIDLRDHFFSHPFEMLCYNDWFWKYFLNPRTNLNRLRLKDHLENFKSVFRVVKSDTVERDEEAFQKTKNRIKQEFLSGDPKLDVATKVWIMAK